jgi:hypothetical protein
LRRRRFLYHYFGRFGFLEGRAGLIASQMRAQYIANVHAKMAELRLPRREPSGIYSNA